MPRSADSRVRHAKHMLYGHAMEYHGGRITREEFEKRVSDYARERGLRAMRLELGDGRYHFRINAQGAAELVKEDKPVQMGKVLTSREGHVDTRSIWQKLLGA